MLNEIRSSNLKDNNSNLSLPNSALVKEDEKAVGIFHSKTRKLITALYMVTDTMENEEPLRLKLRTLGVEILSDMTPLDKRTLNNIGQKINAVLSFLNIASDLAMISEMNFGILQKEFLNLKEYIAEYNTKYNSKNNSWLEEFIGNGEGEGPSFTRGERRTFSSPNGQSTRIGVQKGSTLLHAIGQISLAHNHDNFGILKNKRREEIISIIKDKKNTNGFIGLTITDIKNFAKGQLVSCGEKTLQRELVSMVKDGVLSKAGSKRWSRYSIK